MPATTAVTTPPQTVFLVDPIDLRAEQRTRMRSTVIAPYAAQRAAASLILEAAVTPPKTQTIVKAVVRPAVRPNGSVTTSYDAARAGAGAFLTSLVTPRQRTFVNQATPERPSRRPRGKVADSYTSARAAASGFLESFVTPPKVQTLVQAVRSPRRPSRRVLAPYPQGLIFSPVVVSPPLIQPIVVKAAIDRKAIRPKLYDADNYASARAAASLILEALVTPPKVQNIVQAARSPRRPARTVFTLRSQGLIITPPPPSQRLIQAIVVETHARVAKRVGSVIAPYGSQRGSAATTLYALVTPPRPTRVLQGRRPRQRPLVGRVRAPRPTFITGGTGPSVGTLVLVDPTPYNHVVASTIAFAQMLVGDWSFSASYSSGGETFVVPAVNENVVISMPPVGGFTFQYKAGKMLAFTGAGTEVAGGTNLSTLGSIRWYGMFR
jgi:hypothetical protein